MSVFYHEKSHMYQRALDFALLADEVAQRLPRYRFYLKGQLWRASTSIPLNIAEGMGGHTGPSRIHFYRIARGSAAECSSIFDYTERLKLIPNFTLPRQQLEELGMMLGSQIHPHLRRKK